MGKFKIIGQYPSMLEGEACPPIYDRPISPRENFYRYINGQDYLWFPDALDTIQINPRIVPDMKCRAMVSDCLPFDPEIDGGGIDMFGIEWKYVPEVGGSMVKPGNPKVKDIEHWEDYITFPDIDAWDWEGAAKRTEKIWSGDRLVITWVFSGLFERLISFIDFSDALVALVDEDMQEAVHRLFDKLCVLYDDLFEHFRKYIHTDMIFFHDDWGSQRAPLFSADTVNEMLVPYMKRIVESAHKRGMLFNHHSCGKLDMLFPEIMSTGADMWNGQNVNDFDALDKEYPNRHVVFDILPVELGRGIEVNKELALKTAEDILKNHTTNRTFYELCPVYLPGVSETFFEKMNE